MSIKAYTDKNGNTRYYTSFYYTDFSGERRRKKIEGFTRRKDAKAAETAFLEKITGSSNMAFKSLCDLYIADCKTRLKQSTLIIKQNIIDNVCVPFFGSRPINDISGGLIRNWQNQLLTHTPAYKPTYLKLCNTQLSAVFNYGVKYYGLRSNPVHIAGTIGKAHSGRIDFYTVSEYKLFMQNLTDSKPLRIAFELLFYAGLRCGELLALTVSDFNANDDTISINKTYQRIMRKDVITTPKTEKSKRIIQLPHAAAVHLNEYIKTMYEPQPQERLFATLNKHTLKVAVTQAANKAGLKEIRLHDFRHSHASMLIELGFPPLVIAERLGHEDIKTTLQIYSHLYPSKASEVANKLNAFMVQ